MTRLYDEKGRLTTATVIEAGGNRILQVKNADKDGYGAVRWALATRSLNASARRRPAISRRPPRPPKIHSRVPPCRGEAAPENADIAVTVFEVGQFVDVIGQSKGKGFQGVVKKHNFDGQPASHGSMMHRRNGAIGNRSTPGRVWKNMGMPGHMGRRARHRSKSAGNPDPRR